MNADDARALTEASLERETLRPHLDKVYAKIRDAAAEGRSDCNYIFRGLDRTGEYRPYLRKALIKLLQADGFKIRYHDNSASTDPRDCSYYSASW